MKLGIHVSTAGGIDQAVPRAFDLGCNTFQVFVSNPRGWKPNEISDEVIASFRAKYQIDQMVDAIAHSIYLINLASEDEKLVSSSITSLSASLLNVDRLGLLGLVTHIGSHHGDGLEVGIKRVIDSINRLFDKTKVETLLLLENTAGAGHLVGQTFAEIGQIIDGVDSDKIGVCLDTAHALESGYDLREPSELEKMIKEIEDHIGLEKLRAIHLNDSLTDLGTNRDRHAEFGEGLIGEKALINFINHPKLRDLPFIMETPKLKEGILGRKFIEKIRSFQT